VVALGFCSLNDGALVRGVGVAGGARQLRRAVVPSLSVTPRFLITLVRCKSVTVIVTIQFAALHNLTCHHFVAQRSTVGRAQSCIDARQAWELR
jgi:hypothetical protein